MVVDRAASMNMHPARQDSLPYSMVCLCGAPSQAASAGAARLEQFPGAYYACTTRPPKRRTGAQHAKFDFAGHILHGQHVLPSAASAPSPPSLTPRNIFCSGKHVLAGTSIRVPMRSLLFEPTTLPRHPLLGSLGQIQRHEHFGEKRFSP